MHAWTTAVYAKVELPLCMQLLRTAIVDCQAELKSEGHLKEKREQG